MKELTEYMLSKKNPDNSVNEASLASILNPLVNNLYGEIIDTNKSFPTPGHRYKPDVYLINGIQALGWESKTVVEVVSYLDYRSLNHAYENYKKLRSINEVNKFILLYYKTNFTGEVSGKMANANFELIRYKTLEDKVEKIKSEIKSGRENDSKKVIHPEKENKESPVSNSQPEEKIGYTKISETDIKNVGKNIEDELSGNKDWQLTRNEIMSDLKGDLEKDTVTLFLGAGVSSSAKMPGWGKLLEEMLTKFPENCNLKYYSCDINNVLHACGDSYIIAARYINHIIDKEARSKIIQDVLYKDVTPSSELIKNLCELIKNNRESIVQAITTNYDDLVETELTNLDYSTFMVTGNTIIPKRKFPIYHVHGSINNPKNEEIGAPVLSEDDYHELYLSGHHWSNSVILHALQHTHCVFVGLSMTDPNLRRLMEAAKRDEPRHYVFLPRTPLYEGYHEYDVRNERHFKVQEEIMKTLDTRIIWYNKNDALPNPHEELNKLIGELCNGAASEIPDVLGKTN